MKGPATQQERVVLARPRAATALAHLTDPAWTFARDNFHRDAHVLALVRIAIQDYRLRYPLCQASSAWLFYDGNPKTKRIKGTPERVDVYCLFCRVLLVNGAIWQHDYTDQLRPHTTLCALRSLAGLMEPGAPNTYRLPASTDGVMAYTLTPEAIRHAAIRVREVGDVDLIALCDEALADPTGGAAERLAEHVAYNPDLVQWMATLMVSR